MCLFEYFPVIWMFSQSSRSDTAIKSGHFDERAIVVRNDHDLFGRPSYTIIQLYRLNIDPFKIVEYCTGYGIKNKALSLRIFEYCPLNLPSRRSLFGIFCKESNEKPNYTIGFIPFKRTPQKISDIVNEVTRSLEGGIEPGMFFMNSFGKKRNGVILSRYIDTVHHVLFHQSYTFIVCEVAYQGNITKVSSMQCDETDLTQEIFTGSLLTNCTRNDCMDVVNRYNESLSSQLYVMDRDILTRDLVCPPRNVLPLALVKIRFDLKPPLLPSLPEYHRVHDRLTLSSLYHNDMDEILKVTFTNVHCYSFIFDRNDSIYHFYDINLNTFLDYDIILNTLLKSIHNEPRNSLIFKGNITVPKEDIFNVVTFPDVMYANYFFLKDSNPQFKLLIDDMIRRNKTLVSRNKLAISIAIPSSDLANRLGLPWMYDNVIHLIVLSHRPIKAAFGHKSIPERKIDHNKNNTIFSDFLVNFMKEIPPYEAKIRRKESYARKADMMCYIPPSPVPIQIHDDYTEESINTDNYDDVDMDISEDDDMIILDEDTVERERKEEEERLLNKKREEEELIRRNESNDRMISETSSHIIDDGSIRDDNDSLVDTYLRPSSPDYTYSYTAITFTIPHDKEHLEFRYLNRKHNNSLPTIMQWLKHPSPPSVHTWVILDTRIFENDIMPIPLWKDIVGIGYKYKEANKELCFIVHSYDDPEDKKMRKNYKECVQTAAQKMLFQVMKNHSCDSKGDEITEQDRYNCLYRIAQLKEPETILRYFTVNIDETHPFSSALNILSYIMTTPMDGYAQLKYLL